MALKVKTKSGKDFFLLNPAEKGRRAAAELKANANCFTGEQLSNAQRSYRAGYLAARQDSAEKVVGELRQGLV